MNNSNAQTAFDKLKREVPKDEWDNLKSDLDNAKEEKIDNIDSLPLVKTKRVTLLSYFLGWTGVDSFMVRNKFHGFIKSICSAVIIVLMVLAAIIVPLYKSYYEGYGSFLTKYQSIQAEAEEQIKTFNTYVEDFNKKVKIVTDSKADTTADTFEEISSLIVTIKSASADCVMALSIYDVTYNSVLKNIAIPNHVKNVINNLYNKIGFVNCIDDCNYATVTFSSTEYSIEKSYSEENEKVILNAQTAIKAITNNLAVFSYDLSVFTNKITSYNVGSNYFYQSFGMCSLIFSITLLWIVIGYWIYDIFTVGKESKKINYTTINQYLLCDNI